MMPLLDNKVVFISGGSQGLGAAIARAAVRECARVVVTGRRPGPGEKLVAEFAEQGVAALFPNCSTPTSPSICAVPSSRCRPS